MIRTQIQLEPEQHRKLRKWARRLGISLAEAVRRCVAERLEAEERAAGPEGRLAEALAVIGRYADEERPSRAGKEHDAHLARIYRR